VKTDIQNPVEVAIASRLIDAILAEGYRVSVWEGEDHAIENSTDKAAIMAALASTCMDWINVHDEKGHRVGAILLVYGNGEDLISDHIDNEISRRFADLANGEA
jgi:hypothetical protein